MYKTEDEIKQEIYKHLSMLFEDYRSGWIFEDFFKDPVSGFDHFENNLGTQSFSHTFEDDQDFIDYCYDFASDIASELKRNDLFHTACQMFN